MKDDDKTEEELRKLREDHPPDEDASEFEPCTNSDLRQAAENRLDQRRTSSYPPQADTDLLALLHELQVHQIELERQNEELLKAEATAAELFEKYSDLFDFTPIGYFLWNTGGQSSFYDTFQVTSRETEGRFLYEIGTRQWDISQLRRLPEEIFPQNSQFGDFQASHDFSGVGHKMLLLNARRMAPELSPDGLILLAMEDITNSSKERS